MTLTFVFAIISLCFAGLSYLLTMNYYIAIGVFLLFIGVFILLLSPLCKKMSIKRGKRHESYRFVNSFIISLSVTESSERAFESACSSIESPEFLDMLDHLSSLSIDEKLTYLEKYFLTAYYPTFISVFKVYQDQGGDILKMADPLLKEMTRSEEYEDSIEKEGKRKLFQFSTLWLLSSLILIFIRFALKNYYSLLAKSLPYILICISYFAIVLVSSVIYLQCYTGEKVSFSEGGKNAKQRSQKAE